MFDTICSVALSDAQLEATLTFVDELPRTALAVIVRPTVISIAWDVARRRGNVTPDEIMSAARDRRITDARHEVWWEARRLGMSLNMIGRRFPSQADRAHVDHATVRSGIIRHGSRRRRSALAEVAADNAASARMHGAAS